MPVMDGMAATREIRTRELASGRARTPIVAVTANAMSHHVDQCLDAGMDAHVSKPIRTQDLVDTINRLLVADAAGEDAAEEAAA